MIPQPATEFELLPFFELTPDLVCIAKKEGYFLKINQSVINKLGYTREELFARPISSLVHPDDREITHLEREKMIHGKPLINFQNRYIHKNGSIIWLEWTSIYFPDKEQVFAIAKDVTHRKATEKEIEEKYIRFKSLATHFKGSIERDRKYLAVEMHEELAQLASVVKMDLDWIRNQETGLSEAAKNRLEHSAVVNELLMNAIRRISFSMSPNMLDDLGLIETLQWHSNEFSKISGIPCTLSGTCNELFLSKEVQLDIFRICQEALHNVMYHAEATAASITILETPEKLTISVLDNGKGFDQGSQTHTPGLTSMRERAASIHANLRIASAVGKGTSVELEVVK